LGVAVYFVVRVVVNALALAVAAWLFDGITVTGSDTGDKTLTLLIVGLVFGLVNAIVAPIVKLLSLPFIILTLGLLLIVINAFMLLLTSKIADALDLGFHVDGFWTAVWGSIVISIVSTILGAVLDDR
jgi:putative membrane protein